MLTLSGSNEGQLHDPERPLVISAVDISEAHEVRMHSHIRKQLLFSVKGSMRVTVGGRKWSVTPRHGIWAPTGVKHAISSPGAVSYRSVYVDPHAAKDLPVHAIPVKITRLVRELIVEAASFGKAYRCNTPEARLITVLFDWLGRLRHTELPVPIPRDPRLAPICDRLLRDPCNHTSLGEWETVCGASYRTLARIFLRETGLTFTAWRERVRLTFAIERLLYGESITAVAFDLGYSSPSAFSAMFRRVLEVSPSHYLSKKQ